MIQMIKNWYKVKKIRLALKSEFYSTLETIVHEKEDVKKLINNTYNILKDTPKENLQDKLIEQIALLIHETNSNGKQ